MLITDKEAEATIAMQENIFIFIENMWGLTPQPPRPEHEAFIDLCILLGDYEKIEKKHFQTFVKYKHITWQQFLILSAYQRAVNGDDKREVSVVSGHGVGKSASIAWIIFHFLFAWENCNVACTAPSKEQMFGVLWKEASLWHSRMQNEQIRSFFRITSDKIVVQGREKQWWANAKTASVDKPEALSGIHSDNVLLLADEASAIHDKIFENASGSLTNENYVFIMISNGTKDTGLFYRSHENEDEAPMYQHLRFNSEDSPVVKPEFCKKTLKKAGNNRDHDLYRVRVRGLFPKKGSMDNKNWMPLVHKSCLNEVDDNPHYEWDPEKTVLGIDPAGKGQDETVWMLRDNFRCKIIGWEEISNDLSIARQTWALLRYYKIIGCPIVIDNFGVGANAGLKIVELANIPNFSQFIYGVNVGDKLTNPRLKAKFYNQKAYLYDKMNAWLMWGGEITKDKRFRDELSALLYTFDENEIIRMISKKVLKAEGIKSPNCWDSLMLTFKLFDIATLDEKSTANKHNLKHPSLSNTSKKGTINNEDDYLNDHL